MTILSAGQVAVITGGAAGIGLAMAETFVARGLRVALADTNGHALDAAAEKLRAQGVTVLAQPTDVADAASVQRLRDAVLKTFGRVDVLCNNAGVYDPLVPVWQADVARWRRLFEINFWGVVHGIQAFVPEFVRQGHGHVINTASMSGLTVLPKQAPYTSSKHAVVALSETLRADLDAAGAEAVGVTIVCPGPVRTAMGKQALDYFAAADPNRPDTTPFSAAMLDPAEIAAAALRGLENDRLHVIPAAGSRERLAPRLQRLLDAARPA